MISKCFNITNHKYTFVTFYVTQSLLALGRVGASLGGVSRQNHIYREVRNLEPAIAASLCAAPERSRV